MSSTLPPYETTIAVTEDDIDLQGHVSNIVYLRWVQEVAITHWESAAPQDDQEQLMWVVSRHEIDYKNSALLGDVLRVRTWVGQATRLSFERHTSIHRESDGVLVVQVRTVWIPVNKATRKPQRLRGELREMFSVGGES